MWNSLIIFQIHKENYRQDAEVSVEGNVIGITLNFLTRSFVFFNTSGSLNSY